MYPYSSIYWGDFWGNMKQGRGKIQRPDGSIFEGTWEANNIVGEGKVTIVVGNKDKKDGLPKQVSLLLFLCANNNNLFQFTGLLLILFSQLTLKVYGF